VEIIDAYQWMAFNAKALNRERYTMSSNRFTTNTRFKLLAGALMLGVGAMAGMTSIASAQSNTLVGGGSTLPAVGYVGIETQEADPTVQRQFTPSDDSLFGVYSLRAGNPVVSYCQSGSGAGKAILAMYEWPNNVQMACPGGNTPTGFGAPAAGRSDLAQANFAASDSPLTSADFGNYTAGHAGNLPVQLPAIAGSVAIALNKAGVPSYSLNLSDAQICGVFAGQITNWSTLTAGAVSGPIRVVFRSDGSGTTFALSNHLAAVCQAAGVGTASKHFIADQSFRNVVAQFNPTIPSTWIGVSGGPAVANSIYWTDGTIGYVEMVNALIAGPNFAGLNFAKVNGFDPSEFGAASVPVNVVFNQVINGVNASTGRPALAAISPVPTSQCIALVNPSDYANPSGYPIVAVSYLLGNMHGNGGDLAHTRGLLGSPYNTALRVNVGTIGAGLGLAYLSTTINQSKVDSCLVD
jgi:ABC-type phosphate transport system substrate-binding protein